MVAIMTLHAGKCCHLVSEQEAFEVTSENRHRGCGRDMLGQTAISVCISTISLK